MLFHITRRLSAALFALIAVSGNLFAAPAAQDAMLDTGDTRLHVIQQGEGPYTVVFEAGFASDLSAWRKVAPEVAKRARVLLYSRAGSGQSPAIGTPQTLEQSAARFARMLAAADARAPYILVGHSYGALLMRAFAGAHPEQVAGLVLVDPADEGLETALRALDARRVEQDRMKLLSLVPQAWQGELKLVQQIMDSGKLPPMAALPDVPAVLISSVRADPGADFFLETPAAVRIKRARHQAFFAQFSSGAHVVTANSGHAIAQQEPELVVAAIGQVIDAASKAAERRARTLARQVLMGKLERAAALLAADPAGASAAVAAALRESQLGEAQINSLGFDLLNKGKQAAMAGAILHYNAQTFAQSHNAADSHGDVLMAQGKARAASAEYARALALGKAAQASERTLTAYQDKLRKASHPGTEM